jgi:uncharacterized protein
MQLRLLLIAAVILLTACAQSDEDLKQELATTLSEAVIIPAYRNFAAEVAMLRSGIDRYCTGGREGAELRVPQEYWRTVMTAWQQTAAYTFGPVARHDLPALINYQSIRKNRIHYWLEPGHVATAVEIKNYSVQGKGLGTLEYLLFETDIGKERTGTQYCSYLAALAGDLQANAQRILQLLQTDGLASGELDHGNQGQQIMDELLNTVLQTAETIKDEKLAMPPGKKQNGAVQVDMFESWRSGHSLQNIRANIVSIQVLFYGTIEPAPEPDPVTLGGLRRYLQKTGQPEVAMALEQALQKLIQELDQIGNSTLQTALREQPAAIEMIYQDVATLCHTLETAVLPAFDVQPGFNAKDGD